MNKKIVFGCSVISVGFTTLAAMLWDGTQGPSETVLAECGASSVVEQSNYVLPDKTVFNIEGSSGISAYTIDNSQHEIMDDMIQRFSVHCKQNKDSIQTLGLS